MMYYDSYDELIVESVGMYQHWWYVNYILDHEYMVTIPLSLN